MPTYIYNYDSTNDADKEKELQPRYLGGSILGNHNFYQDFGRGDPAIVLLENGEYILPNQSSEGDYLSKIKSSLDRGYLALVFSKIQFQKNGHILGQFPSMTSDDEVNKAIQFNGRFCYYKLEENILKINILFTSDSIREIGKDGFATEGEVEAIDYSTFQQTNVDLSNVVTVAEFFENPYVLGKLFSTNEDRAKSDYDAKLNEFKQSLNGKIESLSSKEDGFGTFEFKGDSKLNIIWKREDSGEIKLSMPKFLSEKLFIAHDQQGMRPSEINSKNLAKIKYNGDVSSCVEYDSSWGTETDDFNGSYREYMEEAIRAENSKVLQSAYSLKQYMKNDSQAPNRIEGIENVDLLNVANSCFDEKKVDQICNWLEINGGSDLVKIFRESNKENILKYMLHEYIKDKDAPSSLNKIISCAGFYKEFYQDEVTFETLIKLADEAVRADSLKVEKTYNMLLALDKEQANTFVIGKGIDNVLEALLDEYIKDTDPLSQNKMEMCVKFFEEYYPGGDVDKFGILIEYANEAVQADALKIEKIYNLLLVLGEDKAKANEFIDKRIKEYSEAEDKTFAGLWALIDTWYGFNGENRDGEYIASLKEMIRKTRDEVGTAPKQDFLANVRASVSYLYPDNDLQDKVQNSYKKSAIKFVLILGLLIVLNYLFSFATLAVIVLNFVIGMANLILPAHIQLLQVLVLPMLTSFCLNVGLVLCLSCLVYDASVALAKDSAEEQDLLWLYSIGIKGKADTVYMLADALFYRTTMPFFASYFAGYGVVEVAVNAGQAVKPVRSSGISEGTNDDRQKEGVKSQSADSLVDRYAILRKARCIRHQDCHTASGGRSSAQKP
jgi:hypothetical protein